MGKILSSCMHFFFLVDKKSYLKDHRPPNKRSPSFRWLILVQITEMGCHNLTWIFLEKVAGVFSSEWLLWYFSRMIFQSEVLFIFTYFWFICFQVLKLTSCFIWCLHFALPKKKYDFNVFVSVSSLAWTFPHSSQ